MHANFETLEASASRCRSLSRDSPGCRQLMRLCILWTGDVYGSPAVGHKVGVAILITSDSLGTANTSDKRAGGVLLLSRATLLYRTD